MNNLPYICSIPVNRAECEDLRINCNTCKHATSCDLAWISQLWCGENKQNGKNTLLGPYNPAFVKPDIRAGHIISITKKYDFCCFNVPRNKDIITISDIYVAPEARGQGISKKLLVYLMETYDRDIFAKCIRGSSAEAFWQHVGVQLDANQGACADMYEHPVGKNGNLKRDLGWYLVTNKNKMYKKEALFE